MLFGLDSGGHGLSCSALKQVNDDDDDPVMLLNVGLNLLGLISTLFANLQLVSFKLERI